MSSEAGMADDRYARALLERLPVAVFVIDETGTVSFASTRAAALVGRQPDEVVGESVLRFVASDSAWAYAAAVAMATDYADTVMGPLRISFVDDEGEIRRADLWATNHLDDPTVRGIVCTITPETTAMGLGEAVATVAGREGFGSTAARVVTALRGHPVCADAVVYRRAQGELRAVTPLPPGLEVAADPSGPLGALCAQTLDHGTRHLGGDLEILPARERAAAEQAGYRAVWIEPVDLGAAGVAAAAIAMWRRHEGRPSPNELNAVYQAASILALALGIDRAS